MSTLFDRVSSILLAAHTAVSVSDYVVTILVTKSGDLVTTITEDRITGATATYPRHTGYEEGACSPQTRFHKETQRMRVKVSPVLETDGIRDYIIDPSIEWYRYPENGAVFRSYPASAVNQVCELINECRRLRISMEDQ